MSVALLSIVVACGGGAPESAPGTGADENAAAELPSGHPPIASNPDMSLPAVSPSAGVGAAGLTWSSPDGWVAEVPSSSMRRAQYRVPGTAGDGVCVVFYFGPGQGGDVESNVMRWADEFTQPDGRSSRDLVARRQFDVGGVAVTTVELTGMHSGGMSPMGATGERRDGQMLLGAIASGPDANWFFKCTGPEATMREQAAAFDGLLQSLSPGAGS